jgi:hypothetical protein
MGEIMRIFKKVLKDIGLTEIIFCAGLFFISLASYKANNILGLYAIGLSFLVVSIILAKAERK